MWNDGGGDAGIEGVRIEGVCEDAIDGAREEMDVGRPEL